MYGILSTDKRNITRTFTGNSVAFKSGDFAYDTLQVGSTAQLNLRNAAQLEQIGVVRIVKATWNKQTEVATNFSFEKKSGGYINVVDGNVQQLADVSPKPFEGPQRELRGRIDGKRDQIQSAGILVTVSSVEYIVATDPTSRDLLNGSVNLVNEGGWDTTDFWTVKAVDVVDGTKYVGATTDLVLTGDQLKAIGVAVGNHVKLSHGASRLHKAAVDALIDLDSVLAYDLEAGWPEVAPTESAPVEEV